MDRRKIDVGLSSILIAVSVIILTNDNLTEGGMETELGSMFVPRLIAGFIILFSGILGAQALVKLRAGTKMGDTEYISTTGFAGVGIYFSIFIIYWLIVPHVGFLVATPFIVMAVSYLLGGRRWVPMIAISIAISLFIYFGCSQYLRVFLPTWSLT